jgi:hypothetical protein
MQVCLSVFLSASGLGNRETLYVITAHFMLQLFCQDVWYFGFYQSNLLWADITLSEKFD